MPTVLQVVLAIFESEKTSPGAPETVAQAATAEWTSHGVSVLNHFAFRILSPRVMTNYTYK